MLEAEGFGKTNGTHVGLQGAILRKQATEYGALGEMRHRTAAEALPSEVRMSDDRDMGNGATPFRYKAKAPQ